MMRRVKATVYFDVYAESDEDAIAAMQDDLFDPEAEYEYEVIARQ